MSFSSILGWEWVGLGKGGGGEEGEEEELVRDERLIDGFWGVDYSSLLRR